MIIDKTIEEKFYDLLRGDQTREVIEIILTEKLQEHSIQQEYLTRKQAAEYLGVCLSTIDNYVSRGLKKIKIGHSTRIKKSDLEAFIQNQHPP